MKAELTESWLSKLSLKQILGYLQRTGWMKDQELRNYHSFTSPEHEDTQILLPMHPEYGDYYSRLREVFELLGEVENRHAIDVLNDISILPLVDEDPRCTEEGHVLGELYCYTWTEPYPGSWCGRCGVLQLSSANDLPQALRKPHENRIGSPVIPTTDKLSWRDE